jgi:hypothetical protein
MTVRSSNSCPATASKPRAQRARSLVEATYVRHRASYLRRASLGIEISGSSFALLPISTISAGAATSMQRGRSMSEDPIDGRPGPVRHPQ